MRACHGARYQALICVEAHPFSVVEFFGDFLALLFELSCLLLLVFMQELAFLFQLESEDTATFSFHSDWIRSEHANLWFFRSTAFRRGLFLSRFIFLRWVRILVVRSLVNNCERELNFLWFLSRLALQIDLMSTILSLLLLSKRSVFLDSFRIFLCLGIDDFLLYER